MVYRPPKRFYEFGTFRIDVDERELQRDGRPIQLTPKVFDILLTLVENSGHTVSKSALMERVWTDAFVQEGNLNRNVSTLRKILGEDSHSPHFIKTVPKRGYRFDSDVREITESDEELILEKRTSVRVSLTESTRTSRLSSHWLVFAGSIAVIVLISLWFLRPPYRDANALTVLAAPRESAKPEAIELYRQARELWKNRSVEGLHQATIDLERAVMIDPEFAQAQAALADAYAFDVVNWRRAEAVANEAMRLDPLLGQPYATIGFIRMYWEQKLEEAEQYFKKAVLLDPNYATGHHWYALNLIARRSGGSALAEIKRALEIEPDSSAINADLCQILYFSRKYDLAVEQCKKTLDIDPQFLVAHQHLYEIYTAMEKYDEAIREYFAAEDLYMTTGSYPKQIDQLRIAYDSGGIRAFWKRKTEIESGSSSAWSIAKYHARLGNDDEAIRWFKKSGEKKEFEFIFFAADPVTQSLRHGPEGRNLIRDHLGLEPN